MSPPFDNFSLLTHSTNFQVRKILENIEDNFIGQLLNCLEIINDSKLIELKY